MPKLTNPNLNLSIRKAKPADMPAAYQLIKELAAYEKALEQVVLSLEQFVKDGFGEQPLFHLNVAIAKLPNHQEKVVGISLFYLAYSTWKGKMVYLDDLVVSRDYRKMGIGQMLLGEIFDFARQENAQQVRWHVLDWNRPAINLYKKLNAKLENDWITCKIEQSVLYKK